MKVSNYITSKKIDDVDLFETVILVSGGVTLTLPVESSAYSKSSVWVISLEDDNIVGGEIVPEGSLAFLSCLSSTWSIHLLSSQMSLGIGEDQAYPGDLGDAANTTANNAYTLASELQEDFEDIDSNVSTAYSHSQSPHAPVNAQKNSDITKGEIEVKLTGVITTHSHESNSLNTFYEPLVVEGAEGPELLFSEGDIIMAEVSL